MEGEGERRLQTRVCCIEADDTKVTSSRIDDDVKAKFAPCVLMFTDV